MRASSTRGRHVMKRIHERASSNDGARVTKKTDDRADSNDGGRASSHVPSPRSNADYRGRM